MSDGMTDRRSQSENPFTQSSARKLQGECRSRLLARLMNMPFMADAPEGDVKRIIKGLAMDVWIATSRLDR